MIAVVPGSGCDDHDQDTLEDVVAVPTLPSEAYCDPAGEAPQEWSEVELEVLARINAHRAEGFECPELGWVGPSPALQPAGGPWCAARVHVRDMIAQEYFDHEDPDGALAWDRLRAAGYAFVNADEVIAAADLSVQRVVDELWMTRPGSCAALMAEDLTSIGIGYAQDDDPMDDAPAGYFTVVVSTPWPG